MACPTVNRTSAKLEAVRAYWGRAHNRNVTLEDDTAGDQTDKYFDLNSIDENYTEAQYYVLMSGTTPATDPAPAGKTKIAVIYVDGDDAATQAALLLAALPTEFLGTVEIDGSISIRNAFIGGITVESYTNATGIVGEICTTGVGGFLGETAQGGVSVSTEQSVTDILGDTSGDVVLDQIIKGSNISAETSLIEATKERLEFLIGEVSGGVVTISGEKLVGYGTSEIYQSKNAKSGRLILHPVRLANSDRTEDFCIFSCAPDMNSLNFSGSDVQQAEMVFTAYKNLDISEEINLAALGDHSVV